MADGQEERETVHDKDLRVPKEPEHKLRGERGCTELRQSVRFGVHLFICHRKPEGTVEVRLGSQSHFCQSMGDGSLAISRLDARYSASIRVHQHCYPLPWMM